MAKYDIYISYCQSEDAKVASWLRNLEELGVSYYSNVRDEASAYEYANKVQSAILESRALLFIYGDNSEDSIEQRQELDFALANNIPVYYMVVRLLGHGVVRTMLRRKQQCRQIQMLGDLARILYPYKYPSAVVPDINTAIPAPSPIPRQETRNEESKPSEAKSKRSWLWLIVVGAVLVVISLGVIILNVTAPQDLSLVAPTCDEEEYLDVMPVSSQEESDAFNEYRKLQEYLEIESSKPIDIEEEQADIADINANSALPHDSEQLEAEHEEKPITAYFIFLIAGIVIGIVLMLLLRRFRRKAHVKLSSNVDVTISIDNRPLATIGADEVYSTHLGRGNYIIDFTTAENPARHNRVIQPIVNDGPYVVFSEFGVLCPEIKFRCFIAGSLALSAERDALRAVVAELHNQWEDDRISISSYTFEDFNRDVVIGGQQKLYDRFIADNADWIVFIIADGIGQKTMNEYRVAMESHMKYGRPKVLFLAHSDSTNDPVVKEIKREIVEAEQYWNVCTSIEQMKSLFYKCLNWDITLLSKQRMR